MNYAIARALVAQHKAHFPLAPAAQASRQARRLIRAKAIVAMRPPRPWNSGPTVLV